MRMLLGPQSGPLTAEDLNDAYPWPELGRWTRGLMLITTEGASVGPDGRSRSISGETDRSVMTQIRRFSDAIVIGAGTFRAERYRPQRPDEQDQSARAALGLAAAPVIVIVSGSLDLPWHEELFSSSLVPPLVVTTARAGTEAISTASEHAELIVMDGDRVEPAALLDALTGRGLCRIICEGGPGLLAQFEEAGQLDELDLTVSPVFTGGGQIGRSTPGNRVNRWQLEQLIEADGFLFGRYLAERSRSASTSAVAT